MYYQTPRGLQRKHEQLERLRKQYFDVCSSNEEAAGAGDNCVWHDNFAYEENQRQMHQLSIRVRELEEEIGRTQVVPLSRISIEKIRMGTQVLLLLEDTKEEKWFFISGYNDGEPRENRIAYNSPMGQALIGLEEGDLCEIKTTTEIKRYEVLEIRSAPQEEFV